MTDDLVKRITEYLTNGGLFNPEYMNHDAVRDLLIECRERIEELEGALILISGYNEHQHPTKKDIDKVINFIIDRESK